MGINARQGLQAQVADCGQPNHEFEFVADGKDQILCRRLKFYNVTDGVFIAGDTVRIEAEGGSLYNNQTIPLAALAVPTDSGTTAATAQQGPYVLQFDQPIIVSQGSPMRVTVTMVAGDATVVWCILEGM